MATRIPTGIGINRFGHQLALDVRRVDDALAQVPAIAAIEAVDPDTYRLIRADLLATMAESGDRVAIEARLHADVTSVAEEYMPRASDDAVLRYGRVTVSEIEQVAGRSADAAFVFLFPRQGAPVDFFAYIDESTLREDSEALADVIRTGATSAPRRADGARIDALMTDVGERLTVRHGKAAQMLGSPLSPGLDRKCLALMVADLYRMVLDLPAPDAALLLRHMWGEKSVSKAAS